jgi:hypothetical protein
VKDLKKEKINAVLEFVFLCLFFYFSIGFFSLIGVAQGEKVMYMPFWHKPWEILFKLLGLI